MFGLSRDFIQQDGISMQLGRPGGLTGAELNMVQARMLMNTDIPHHLRLLLREVDLQVTLEYTVSRRKMLSHLLKSERLSMPDFFGLLLQVARGMEEGRLYMLRTDQYALHEDYIFVEGPLSSGRVYLTYVPLQFTGAAVLPGENMKSLIMVLMASVTELAGTGVQRLLQYCGSEEFVPAGLKDLLAELLADGVPGHKPPLNASYASSDTAQGGTASTVSVTPVDRQPSVRLKPYTDAAQEPAIPRKRPFTLQQDTESGTEQDKPPWEHSLPKLRYMKEEEENYDPEERGNTTESVPSTRRTYIALGAVLADALLWKFLYLDHPVMRWLAVCLIATLLSAAVCWMVWSGRIMLQSHEIEEEQGQGGGSEDAPLEGLRHSRKPGGLEWDFGRNPVVPVRPAVQPKPKQEPEVRIQRNTGEMQIRQNAGVQEGRQLPGEAATALLTRSKGVGTGQEPVQQVRKGPYLERSQKDGDGASEKIELNRTSFIIGRSPEVAQYVENSEGASRVHAEISRGPDGYILKDLDSRNGTLYQGDPMIPYKEYPLYEGSVFTIVKGSYTFRSA